MNSQQLNAILSSKGLNESYLDREPQFLAILGMHRSGTSLAAKWINSCGISVGNKVVGDGVSSSKGHSEDEEILALHISLLRAMGRDKSGIVHSTEIKSTQEIQKRISNLLTEKAKGNQLVAWKEPRTVLFLDTYRSIIPDMKSVIVFRPYSQVVDSLYRRLMKQEGKLDFPIIVKIKRALSKRRNKTRMQEIYLDAWINYNQIIVEHFKKNPKNCVIIELNQLLRDSSTIYKKLEDWGVDHIKTDISTIFNSDLFQKDMAKIYVEDKHKLQVAEDLLVEMRKLAQEQNLL